MSPTEVSHHNHNDHGAASGSAMKLPILSLARITNTLPTYDDWLTTAMEFDAALSTLGFVYLADHGIPAQKIAAGFEESMNFFRLGEDTKMEFERDFNTTFHGYTKVGGIITPEGVSAEYRESFDSALATADSFHEHCKYPDAQAPRFQPVMKDLMLECRSLSKTLLKLMGLALHLENPDFFLETHSNLEDPSIPSYCQLKTLHYPGLSDREAAVSTATRQAAHTDYGTLTLLMQQQGADGRGRGLEVQSPVDGSFIKADPIPGCILVNVGDLLQIWTGGRYPSTIHRVVIPDDETQRSLPRQSIAAFIKPNNDTVVSVLPEFQSMGPSNKHKQQYQPIASAAGEGEGEGEYAEVQVEQDLDLDMDMDMAWLGVTGTGTRTRKVTHIGDTCTARASAPILNAGEHFRRRTIAYRD